MSTKGYHHTEATKEKQRHANIGTRVKTTLELQQCLDILDWYYVNRFHTAHFVNQEDRTALMQILATCKYTSLVEFMKDIIVYYSLGESTDDLFLEKVSHRLKYLPDKLGYIASIMLDRGGRTQNNKEDGQMLELYIKQREAGQTCATGFRFEAEYLVRKFNSENNIIEI